MTNEIIITKLYTEKKYKAISKNVCRKNAQQHWEDIHSEAIMAIHKRGDDLTKIDNITAYFFSFVYLTAKSYTVSKLYGYNYNRPDSVRFSEATSTAHVNPTYELRPSEKLEQLLEPEQSDTWREHYKKSLFKIYIEQGSIRSVAEVTQIPLRTVFVTLNNYKKELLKKIAND